jgi:hypothetical protein
LSSLIFLKEKQTDMLVFCTISVQWVQKNANC